jgi:hypothetical protein
MNPPEPATVVHHPTARRYEIAVAGHLALLDYTTANGRTVFTHTFVPPELRGRGLAELLVRRALADARSQNAVVVPACSYVAAFIQRHPEFHDLLAPN